MRSSLNSADFRNIFFYISTFYFSFFSIIGVYIIYMPKVLENIGYSSEEIGIIFAMSPMVRFLLPFFFLKHLRLTKNIYISALGLALFAAVLFYFTIHNFYLFLLSNIILGISFALILPYAETFALEHLGKEKYGKSRLFGSVGFIIVALLLAKFMNESINALHFLFVTILFTVIFGYKLSFYEKENTADRNNNKNSFSLLKHWRLWINIFLMQVSFGAFYNFFTIYETAHGVDIETVSYLWTFGVVCEIVMLYYQGPLLKKNLYNIIKWSTFTAIFRWLLLYFFPDSVLIAYISQSLHAITFALYYSAAIAYLFQIYENKKLAQQFFGGISFGLGGFAGSILAGIFYGEYLFLYAAGVAFIAWLILIPITPATSKDHLA
ncbi:MFS transporter [Nitrosophilus alvini]|uniref:MFS transporter n=1 Tax=Nitrosophilus alvini TaxID=2714855 RepID=UPI00190A463D|nr:MFS transporter [Nitrosophilus alvini]